MENTQEENLTQDKSSFFKLLSPRTTSLVAFLLLIIVFPVLIITLRSHTNTQQYAATKASAVGCVLPPTAIPSSLPLYLGLDKYLHWDKLSYIEIGNRIAGQSTVDSGGSNKVISELGKLSNGQYILFNQLGTGVITFIRMQQTIGSPWYLTTDSNAPMQILPTDFGQSNPTAKPALLFPYALSLNTTESQGSSIIATQIPFAKKALWTSVNKYGNFYAIYDKLPINTPLPSMNDTNKITTATSFLNCAGNDIAPTSIPSQQGTVTLTGQTPQPLVTLSGPSQIRAIKFHVPFSDMVNFGNSRLQIYWDNETSPSVDAPVKFLIGDGAGVYQPANRPLVSGLLAGANGNGSTFMDFNLYYPMPFSSNARIVLVPNITGSTSPISWSVRYEPFNDPNNWWGNFHANYTDIPTPTTGQDMTFLDVHGSGRLIGTVINFQSVDGTLEGDPHIYVDDNQTPQIAGTGTEEWGMGGNYWYHNNQTSLPMAGLPSSTNNPAGSDIDGAAEYRFLIADSIPFNSHLLVNWEHGGINEVNNHYRATMLWYGMPTQTTAMTDSLDTGSPTSRTAHKYTTVNNQYYSLTAAYEFLVNSPLITNTVASTTKTAEFIMKINPNNQGAFLRRTFDYCKPNQKATVYINGTSAGMWFNAGVSTKTGVDGNNRCWRDDELPLPKSLTSGKSSLDIKIVQASTATGAVWTASDYKLYSFTIPAASQVPTPTSTTSATPTP